MASAAAGPGRRIASRCCVTAKKMEPSALPGKVTGFALRDGDVVIERTAGGGGYGDPLERDAEAVVRDLRFGYVSATAAETTYGVALRDGDEDAEATLALRARLRAQRVVVRTIAGRRRGARRLPADVAHCAVHRAATRRRRWRPRRSGARTWAVAPRLGAHRRRRVRRRVRRSPLRRLRCSGSRAMSASRCGACTMRPDWSARGAAPWREYRSAKLDGML